MNVWETLGLEPTKEAAAIRKTYAERAKTCHPEEDPEGFLELRKAYQAALAYAERAEEAASHQGNSHENNRGSLQSPEDGAQGNRQDEPEDSEPDEPQGPEDWQLPAMEELPNPYQDSEAIQKFAALYTGNQRKNPKAWMDYFTSDAFLAAGWEADFTALLLEKVTETERTLPPSKEFLMWLCVVYQLSVKEDVTINREKGRLEALPRQVECGPGAEFDGLPSILRIAAKGPLPKRPGGDELAMRETFKDYRHLSRLAETGAWNVQAMEEYKQILNRYIPFYIKDRCDPKAKPDLQRHPAGLRVLLHFFRRDDLPEAVCREAWRKLDLKSAIMGRSKILYGLLRELIMERVPGIAGEKPENFLQLNRDHDAYRARIKVHPEQEDAESAAFFVREDLQKALRSPRFVAEQLLTYTNWRREGMGEGLVRRMLCFYQEHPEIPRAAEVVEGMEKDLRAHVARRRNREDAQAEACPWYARLTLRFRPLFRHWLNTAFYTAIDPRTGTPLLEYLHENLPYLPEWSRRFVEQDGTPPPRTMALCMGKVEIDFYRRYIEYRVNGEPVRRPCLSWEQTAAEGGDWFFYLLPLTAAPQEDFDGAAQEIARRLEATAAPEEDREPIARCLAGAVCCLPWEGYRLPPEEVLPLTLYAEGEEQLFGCSWHEGEGALTLFEQTFAGRRTLKQQFTEPSDAEDAARRLLEEIVSPTSFRLPMREAPWHIYFTELSGLEQEWKLPELWGAEAGKHSIAEAAEVFRRKAEHEEWRRREAESAIKALLVRFGRGELRRFELSWFEGQLVFLKEPSGYACLYFEDHTGYDMWYSVLSHPEAYRTVDGDDVVRVPFGMGTLPDYAVHEGPGSILRVVERIFTQLSEGRPKPQGPGGWLWDSHANQQNGRLKWLMACQKLGGMPPRRSHERMEARYVFSRYPVEMETLTLEGERTRTEIRNGSYGKASEGLLPFMGSKLACLRLTWAYKTPEETRRHLVFFQDAGRFLLCWTQDAGERADICTASQEAEIELFQGQPVPAAYVHRDLWTIRNCVDLILDDVDHAEPVIKRYFCPVEPQYEGLLALLAETEKSREEGR